MTSPYEKGEGGPQPLDGTIWFESPGEYDFASFDMGSIIVGNTGFLCQIHGQANDDRRDLFMHFTPESAAQAIEQRTHYGIYFLYALGKFYAWWQTEDFKRRFGGNKPNTLYCSSNLIMLRFLHQEFGEAFEEMSSDGTVKGAKIRLDLIKKNKSLLRQVKWATKRCESRHPMIYPKKYLGMNHP